MNGIIRMLKNGKSAFVECTNEEYFIHGKNLRGALDGDTVEIVVTREREGNKSSEAKVINISKRSEKTITGVLQINGDFGFVVPTEAIGTDIFVGQRNFNGAKGGDMVAVEITKYPVGKKKAEGKITEVLGNSEDTTVVIESIKVANDIVSKFPKEVMTEVKDVLAKGTKVNKNTKRVDLSLIDFVTIDGADAKDLDDAIAVEKLSTGGFRLYVAIADVSHYIKTGTQLDKEALKRGNSTYMLGEVVPMLPKEISNGICSLNPDSDKLVGVCEIDFNDTGDVQSYKFYRSKIKTAHRLTYAKVNEILEKGFEDNKEYLDIEQTLVNAFYLSGWIRGNKSDRGALELDMPEPKFKLDENGKIEEITLRERGEAERIIEDFMIIANECCAKEITGKVSHRDGKGVYRTHGLPTDEAFRRLNYFLAEMGVNGSSSSEIAPTTYQEIIENIKGSTHSIFLQKIALMSLKQAKYTTDNIGHFGLASEGYSHFTSPIRRYADLLAHRIIFGEKIDWEELEEMCKNISKTERKSAKMEQKSIKIKCAEYMLDKKFEVYDGTIVGISKHRIFIKLENHIEVEMKMPEGYTFDEDTYMAVSESGSIFNIGGQLTVVVTDVDMKDHRVIVEIKTW